MGDRMESHSVMTGVRSAGQYLLRQIMCVLLGARMLVVDLGELGKLPFAQAQESFSRNTCRSICFPWVHSGEHPLHLLCLHSKWIEAEAE